MYTVEYEKDQGHACGETRPRSLLNSGGRCGWHRPPRPFIPPRTLFGNGQSALREGEVDRRDDSEREPPAHPAYYTDNEGVAMFHRHPLVLPQQAAGTCLG